jgi:hypothetical protein
MDKERPLTGTKKKRQDHHFQPQSDEADRLTVEMQPRGVPLTHCSSRMDNRLFDQYIQIATYPPVTKRHNCVEIQLEFSDKFHRRSRI